MIIKPPRPGRRGSLELGRHASKLVSKLFGVTHKFVFLIKLESGTLSKHTMVDRLLQF